MQPPIGVSDFRKLIETRDIKGNPYLFVDKSLFIKDIFDDLSEVKLFTRPRRFGKTLNMSMLHHFLVPELENKPTRELFKDLKIEQYPEYKAFQGRYPVVFITFKDIVKENNYHNAYDSIVKLLSSVYSNFQYLLMSEKLSNYHKSEFEAILQKQTSTSGLQFALFDLIRMLYLHHEVKPWVLIDEYDTPIQTAYSSGYYKEMIQFMRGFLGAGLKDNSYLEKAVLSGILRISKESIFSGLNNISTYSLLNSQYGEYFGFTEIEVIELLEKSKLHNHIQEVREWYNGYQSGNTIVYNPWSIVNYIKQHGKFASYWVNISDNTIIKDFLIKSSNSFKSQFEILLQKGSIEKSINESVVFTQLENDDSALWTILLMSGYLKIKSIDEQEHVYNLAIPNKEVKELYTKLISEWLSGVNDAADFNIFLKNLLNGEMHDFENYLQKIMLQTFSVHDIKGKEPEKFYHGFMLGLVAGIDSTQYMLHSNRESGYGRFDIAIIPRDPSKLAIIIEIKSVTQNDRKSLLEEAKKALSQIEKNQYETILQQYPIIKRLSIGVVFSGKDLAVAY